VLLTEILKYENFGDDGRVVVTNNLSATTEMGLAILARHIVPSLEKMGFTVERLYAGTFLSARQMDFCGYSSGRHQSTPDPRFADATPAWAVDASLTPSRSPSSPRLDAASRVVRPRLHDNDHRCRATQHLSSVHQSAVSNAMN
jgi:hypothetical protein